MLRSLVVPVKVPTDLCGDNLGMIISSTNLDLGMKKKDVEISYHKFRECAAARIVNPIKFFTMVNQSDILTKSFLVEMLGSFSECIIWS